jgi:hypothetical protein
MGEQVSDFGGFAVPSPQIVTKARRANELEDLAEHGYESLDSVRSVGRGLFASPDGRLWRASPGEPVHGKRPVETSAFLTDADLNPVWFERPGTGPQTVEELERKQAADAQAADAQRQAETARLRKNGGPGHGRQL